MLEVFEETIVDSLNLLPFLFITYFVMELIEHKAGDTTIDIIKKAGRFGPILGAFLGIIPQCGFSVVAANLYAGRIITIGTVIAIFLSTSDEMLPILLSEGVEVYLIVQILLIKVIIGIIFGTLVDLFFIKKIKNNVEEIHEVCEHEHCHCEENGIVKSAIKHTLQIFLYILIISFVINILVFVIGKNNISSIITDIPIIGILISCLIGTVPNCVSSVILTKMYIENILSMGTMIGGLLMNSGLGMLILFKVNKNKKENFIILLILYVISVISALIINLLF